jgi:hypothetical protein
LKFKAFVLFIMCLFIHVAVAEEGSCLSAISSSQAEKVESSKVNTGSCVEGASSDVAPSLKAVDGDLKTSCIGGHTFSYIMLYAMGAAVGIIDSATRLIVFLCMFYTIEGCWDGCDPSLVQI